MTDDYTSAEFYIEKNHKNIRETYETEYSIHFDETFFHEDF